MTDSEREKRIRAFLAAGQGQSKPALNGYGRMVAAADAFASPQTLTDTAWALGKHVQVGVPDWYRDCLKRIEKQDGR